MRISDWSSDVCSSDLTSRAALAHDGAPRALRLAERAGHAAQTIAQRVLNIPLLRRMAEPLLQLDLNTWIEIQASTASLDRGSHGLLPQADRLNPLGIHSQRAGGGPTAEPRGDGRPGGGGRG